MWDFLHNQNRLQGEAETGEYILVLGAEMLV